MEKEGAEASKRVIKVAAICGSLRKASSNRGLIRSALELNQDSVLLGMQIEYIDISQLPMLNTDLEVDGHFPPAVEVFREKVFEADSILFASPDYNYSVTAPLKNAIDWASRSPNCRAGKAAAMVSAAGGSRGRRAQYHLHQIGVFLDLHFINKPEFFLHAHAPPAKFDRYVAGAGSVYVSNSNPREIVGSTSIAYCDSAPVQLPDYKTCKCSIYNNVTRLDN